MSITITISELRDYMIAQIRQQNFWDGYKCVGRMLCRIGMLTWLMETNGIPGEAEIVIPTVTEEN